MAPTDTVIAVARFEGTDETVTFRPPLKATPPYATVLSEPIGRAMLAPTIIDFSSGKVAKAERASPFPTWMHRKTQHRTNVAREFHGLACTLEPGYQRYMYW